MNSNESFDRTASHMAGEYVSNTESVAYINKDDGLVCAKCFNPLYTHPAKTLTDEEILESFAFYFGSTLNNKAYNDGAILFAKDILRKAQEK